MRKQLIIIFLILFAFTSCKKGKIIFEENFDDNRYHWDTLTNNLMCNKIENGKLNMSSKIDNVINLSLISIEPLGNNISLSTSVIIKNFYDDNGLAGLILFANNKKFPKNYIFFGVNNLNEVIVSQENQNPKLAKTFYKQKNNVLNLTGNNYFSIEITNNSILFLMNQHKIIFIDKPKTSGNYYGYVVQNSNIEVSDFIVKKNIREEFIYSSKKNHSFYGHAVFILFTIGK